MGQTLSEPVTAKESACCQNSQLKVGSSCMQGWRINMEDSHTHILSLPDDPGTGFFGVYDGHGGEILEPYLSAYFSTYCMEKKSTIDCCFYLL
jgi:protein phosphatase 2C family protein 2/3